MYLGREPLLFVFLTAKNRGLGGEIELLKFDYIIFILRGYGVASVPK